MNYCDATLAEQWEDGGARAGLVWILNESCLQDAGGLTMVLSEYMSERAHGGTGEHGIRRMGYGYRHFTAADDDRRALIFVQPLKGTGGGRSFSGM